MVAKFIVLLALFAFGSTKPEPDPSIQINIQQNVNLDCGCVRCPCNKKRILSCDEANIETNIARPNSTILVEAAPISLAFVFDTTGSMSIDLEQVKAGAISIVSTITFLSPIQDYILVPFNDPTVGPMTKTTSSNDFTKAIENIVVGGGGDIAEECLQAIVLALKNVLPNSIIYVFTDAPSKDIHILEIIIRLIHKTKTQVNFVWSGYYSGADDTTYTIIASISHGQIYHVNKADISKIFDYITAVINVKMVLLLSFEFEAGENDFDLPVDATLKEFTVSVSGTNPFIQIIGPRGDDLEVNGDMDIYVDLDNVKIVRVKSPTPGIYSIKVKSDSKYTVRVRGDTSINFEYGFSLTPTANFGETSNSPKAGKRSYIIVKPTDLTDFGDFYRIQMITKNGAIVYESPLKIFPGHDTVYTGTSFIPPEEPFEIKVFGCDQEGNKFERLSATYISAVSTGSTKMLFKAITSGNSTSSAHKAQLKQLKDPRNYPEEQIHNQNRH